MAFAASTLFVLAASALPCAAQRNDDEWLDNCRDRRNDRAVWCDVRVEQIESRSSLHVDAGRNGGIEIVGQDRNDIEVHARLQAGAESSADAADVGEAIRLELEGGTITANGPSSGRDRWWSVSYVIFVPRRVDLDLEANNGPVAIGGVRGNIEAATTNGQLRLSDLSGKVRARTQNGSLSVSLSGSRWDGDGLDAETRNGSVTLSIPDGYSAKLETGTVNGRFESDIPLTVTRMSGRTHRIETTLGQGGATIHVMTTNGRVSIRNR